MDLIAEVMSDRPMPLCHKVKILLLCLLPGKKPQRSDGLLTGAELEYWSENFKLPDNEVPKLPESDFRCFKKKGQPQVMRIFHLINLR